MRFKGKTDWWFYALIAAVATGLVPVAAHAKTGGPAVLAANLLTLAAAEGFCLAILLRNYVELEEDGLLIVFGFVQRRIRYSEIRSLSATNSPLSSLAASLDRIEIQYAGGASVLVALREKELFFREMARRVPRAELSPSFLADEC